MVIIQACRCPSAGAVTGAVDMVMVAAGTAEAVVGMVADTAAGIIEKFSRFLGTEFARF